jgi:tetratricopeptide (TPR) repeat protein
MPKSSWLRRCCLLLAAFVSGCGGGADALARGDALWADSAYEEALAEYKLSTDQNPDDEHALARLAHAYAVVGQLERAREAYEKLLTRAPEYTDQAVFDYLYLADRARARSDRYGMAGAVEAALALRPGLPVSEMAAPLARYYGRAGDSDRARTYYERALAYATPDSATTLLFDYAQLLESQNNCGEAIEMFSAFRQREPRGERADQARWQIGNCSFQLARQMRESGSPERALEFLQSTIDLGVPQNLIGQAWFERGEILLELNRRDEALQAYMHVLENARTAGNQLAERARQRIDGIRFGSGGADSHGFAPQNTPDSSLT